MMTRALTAVLLLALLLPAPRSGDAAPRGIDKIAHVIVIMQENRSFDHYFGTYPGADGIPMKDGKPTVCAPDPKRGTCVPPYPDHQDRNGGGPHGARNAVADVDGGKMDGFISQAEQESRGCLNPFNPACSQSTMPDVMGYHDGSDIPNYWAYARQFVLQDHMFEPTASWSLPAHLFEVSEWSARCSTHDPNSCVNALEAPGLPPDFPAGRPPSQIRDPIYAWTDLTFLLHRKGVSWGYYIVEGTEPDCEDDQKMDCLPVRQNSKTPGIWNPLPWFDTVNDDGERERIQPIDHFLRAASEGTLPAVSWVTPSGEVSEHPPALVSTGQSFVTHVVNAVMKGPNWRDCAIFLAWDDWGGFYDHVVPVRVDQNGYGLRVPGLVISPYAKHGFIDKQVLSFDAYAKFIEDLFLGGERLDPSTDGRPDPRPAVRESMLQLGDLSDDFDFAQPPRAPLILPERPKTRLLAPPRQQGR